MSQKQRGTHHRISSAMRRWINHTTIAFSSNDGGVAFNGFHHIHLTNSTCGMLTSVFFGDDS
jgi:hypothetical protein